MFRDKVHPAFVALPAKWDDAVFGKNYKECITEYVKKYELSPDKTAYLDKIRSLDDPEDIIEKLKEQMMA